MLTPRDRWLAMFAGETSDHILSDYWGTAEVTRRLLKELKCASERALWERLGIDKLVLLGPTHPLAKEDTWHTPSMWSLWHVEVTNISYGDGLGTYEEAATNPLAKAETAADVERFDWPDPSLFDIDGLRAQCEAWHGYPILGGCYEPFYVYCRLRGMEQALTDLSLNPEVAEAALERIYYFHESVIRRTLEAAKGLIDVIYVAEDLGTQATLLMSPASFRRFLKPRMRKMIDLAHSYGAKVMHHDDGAIRPLLAELIELGIDILNPIQWRCAGMGREELARDFGKSVVFHGGVDNQQTLPFGTPDDVKREVADNIRIFRKGKGYVVAPCHNLQPNTPTANILAMYEAVHEYRA
ncbi:MAG TPA: uroporphyrinogen decarboxylase family protein [Terriglobia bacterium]|nr:uroporphyrinogen decarboxylase family protein [Terriglobia bacterium]